MRKSAISMCAIALLILSSTPGLAGTVTIPNTFVAKTKAVAADVNANFSAVKTAVDGNAADIATNAASMATNTGNIAANVTAIGNNTNNIATNTSDIATNATDIASLQQDGNKSGTACVGNDASDIMVRVGPLCVDKYEASVWSTADGSASGTQYGDASDNYPAGCTDTGNGCTGANIIYARSEADGAIKPSSFITWFQAQQACAASGKRLLTNAEWQMAAAGTPDPGAAGSDTVNQCNTNTAGKVATGSSVGGINQCVSNWGVVDMVGNVNEWVADWVQGNAALWATSGNGGVNTATYGSDLVSRVEPALNQATGANFPAAVFRGGGFAAGTSGGVFSYSSAFSPAYSDVANGFRCAR